MESIQRTVMETVGAVLGPVEPGADLTALGATSLQLTTVCARLAAALDRPLPFREFLRRPTVAALTEWLAERQPIGAADEAPGSTDLGPFPAMCLVRQMLRPADRSDYCTLTWIVRGSVRPEALEKALHDVQKGHEALRAAYVFDGRPVGRPAAAGAAEPPQLVRTAAPTLRDGLADVREALADPLDLIAGKVWRAHLCQAGPGLAVFAVVVHHVAFDGWSEAVLAADLGSAYTARLRGHDPAPGAGLPMAQARRLQVAHDLAADLDAQRAGAVAALNGVKELTLGPAAEGSGVRTLSRALPEHTATCTDTPFITHLAAFASALRAMTGQDDFAVGVPVRRRFDARLADAIGNHVTMVPVRLSAPGRAGAPAAIGAAAEAVAEAFGRQDVSLADLARRFRSRSSGNPVYQHIFAYQDNEPAVLELPGAECELVRDGYLLDIATDTMTEVWPPGTGYGAGSSTAAITYRAGMVAPGTASKLLTDYVAVYSGWTQGRADRC